MPEFNVNGLVEEIKTELGEWYDDLSAQLRPRFDQAVKDAAWYVGLLATDPSNEQHKQSLQHVYGTLKNLQLHGAVEAYHQLRTSVSSVLMRVVSIALAAV